MAASNVNQPLVEILIAVTGAPKNAKPAGSESGPVKPSSRSAGVTSVPPVHALLQAVEPTWVE